MSTTSPWAARETLRVAAVHGDFSDFDQDVARVVYAELGAMDDKHLNALVTIEVVERLAMAALAADDSGDGDRALELLHELIGQTTRRTVSHVKDQLTSDTISRHARAEVSMIQARVWETVRNLRRDETPGGE